MPWRESRWSRLGDGVHDGAAEPAVFRVETVSDQAELGHRVDVRNDGRAHVAALADVASIHQEGISRFALAINRDIAGIELTGALAVLRTGAGGDRRDAPLTS